MVRDVVSTTTCIAVRMTEEVSADEPAVHPSLLGRPPGIPRSHPVTDVLLERGLRLF